MENGDRRWLLLVGCALGCGGGAGGGGDGATAPPGCGDGIVQAAEQCDDGAGNSDTAAGACRTTCVPAFCGDGVIDDGEGCDDGAANSDDAPSACRTDCEAPFCGDGVVDDGEACDDGGDNSDQDPDACRESCVQASCGDGVADSGEECDDGDTVDDNNCKNDCTSPALWTQTYDGDGLGAIGYDVAVDASGNLFVAGYAPTVVPGWSDVWLRKYDPDGNPSWTVTDNGAADLDDEGHGVAVDASGNVLVAGHETAVSGYYDIWVRKYDPAGGEVWTRTYDGPGGGDDSANRIATDAGANAFVIGYETSSAGDTDVWIRKYDPAGGTVWTRVFDGAGMNDSGYGIAVDPSGSVLAIGYSTGAAGATSWVRKLDTDGGPVWSRTYPVTTVLDAGYGIASDPSGNPLVTGFEQSLTGSRDVWEHKMDPDGTPLWSRAYDGVGAAEDIGLDGTSDAGGDLLATGWVTVSDGTTDILVQKLDPGGTVLWTRTFDAAGADDAGLGIATDADGNVLVAGVSTSALGVPQVWVRKYEP
jgi:hypothetical protein